MAVFYYIISRMSLFYIASAMRGFRRSWGSVMFSMIKHCVKVSREI